MVTPANQKYFHGVLNAAAEELQQGLRHYWPTDGLNEMSEAHTLGALGRALGHEGFHVFSEVQCRDRNQNPGLVDLVALSPKRSVCLAVEGKRLYDGRGAAGLLRDWERLAQVKLANEWKAPKIGHHYRMLVATTWRPNIISWWKDETDAPRGRTSQAWKTLQRQLSGARRDALYLQHREEWRPEAPEQWLLYVVGQRRSSFF